MTYGDLLSAAQSYNLTIFGSLAGDAGSIILLGPHEPGYWPVLCASPEWQDGGQIRWIVGRPCYQPTGPRNRIETVFPLWRTPCPVSDLGFGEGSRVAKPRWHVGTGRSRPAGVLSRRIGIDYVISDRPSESTCPSWAQPCTLACSVGALNDESYNLEHVGVLCAKTQSKAV